MEIHRNNKDNFLNYQYFSERYKVITKDLTKQKELKSKI